MIVSQLEDLLHKKKTEVEASLKTEDILNEAVVESPLAQTKKKKIADSGTVSRFILLALKGKHLVSPVKNKKNAKKRYIYFFVFEHVSCGDQTNRQTVVYRSYLRFFLPPGGCSKINKPNEKKQHNFTDEFYQTKLSANSQTALLSVSGSLIESEGLKEQATKLSNFLVVVVMCAWRLFFFTAHSRFILQVVMRIVSNRVFFLLLLLFKDLFIFCLARHRSCFSLHVLIFFLFYLGTHLLQMCIKKN